MWCDCLGDIILKHCVVKVNEACGQKLFLSECVCVCLHKAKSTELAQNVIVRSF